MIFRAIASCVVQANVLNDWKQGIKTCSATLRTGKPDLLYHSQILELRRPYIHNLPNLLMRL